MPIRGAYWNRQLPSEACLDSRPFGVRLHCRTDLSGSQLRRGRFNSHGGPTQPPILSGTETGAAATELDNLGSGIWLIWLVLYATMPCLVFVWPAYFDMPKITPCRAGSPRTAKNLWGLPKHNFYRPDTLRVAQQTASRRWTLFSRNCLVVCSSFLLPTRLLLYRLVSELANYLIPTGIGLG